MEKPFSPDMDVLERHLAKAGLTLDRSATPKRCAGGLANLNFELVVDKQPVILRRAPSGPLPKGAHDMAREHRVLSRLADHFALAPRSFHLCEDASVLGAPFQLIEFRQGRVFRGDDLSGLNKGEDLPAVLPGLLANAMADLHAVDPGAVGLHTLGRPAGFVPRNAARWSNAAVAMSDGTPHASLARETADLVGTQFDNWIDGDVSLLHCDIKLDNLIIADDGLRAVALLDWDMATLGDPIYDLATLLSYWTEPGDPEGMQRLRQMPTGHPGFPSRGDMAAAYGAATGRSLGTLSAMRALCQLKLAVIFLQLHARWVDGALGDTRYAEFGALGVDLLEYARDVARGTRD